MPVSVYTDNSYCLASHKSISVSLCASIIDRKRKDISTPRSSRHLKLPASLQVTNRGAS